MHNVGTGTQDQILRLYFYQIPVTPIALGACAVRHTVY